MDQPTGYRKVNGQIGPTLVHMLNGGKTHTALQGQVWHRVCAVWVHRSSAMLATALAASPLDRSGDLSAPPRAADLPNRTRSWFRPAGGVSDCPLDAPVILLKMARAGSSDVVQNLGKALPACRWDAELLHETNEFLNAGDYNKCNDAALAEEQRLFREAMGERSIISHNPVSTAGGCFSFAVERTGDGAMGGLPRLQELLDEPMPRRGVTIAWIRHNALRAAVSDHWMAVSGTVHSDGGTRSSTHYPKWGAPARDIVLATVRWLCNTRLLLETVGGGLLKGDGLLVAPRSPAAWDGPACCSARPRQARSVRHENGHGATASARHTLEPCARWAFRRSGAPI